MTTAKAKGHLVKPPIWFLIC